MAKGTEAKNNVVNILEKAFGSDWIGEYDKKYYVWADDNGEKVQISITLICPKKPVGVISAFEDEDDKGDLNFETMPPKPVEYQKAEITAEEQQTVEDLMARLGL